MNEGRKYRTKQRDEIHACMQKTGGEHFTAADIATRMRERGSTVGLSTIYRLLDQMVEDGEMRRYIIDGTSAACYQLPENDSEKCRHHYHLKCELCGKLFHVECAHIDEFSAHLQSEHGFTVDHSKTVFYGICAECAKKEQGTE